MEDANRDESKKECENDEGNEKKEEIKPDES